MRPPAYGYTKNGQFYGWYSTIEVELDKGRSRHRRVLGQLMPHPRRHDCVSRAEAVTDRQAKRVGRVGRLTEMVVVPTSEGGQRICNAWEIFAGSL